MEKKTLFQIPIDQISPNPHNPRLIFYPHELDKKYREIQGQTSKVESNYFKF